MKLLISLAVAISALSNVSVQAQSTVPTLNICTGGESGKYYQTARELGVQLKGIVQVNAVATNGSVDNLNKLLDGTCDAAIIQSDAYGFYTASKPAARLDFKRTAELYNEYVHLVCNKDAEIESVGDVRNEGIVVATGPNGSGSQVTWETWAKQDPNYAKVATVPEGGLEALSLIVQGVEAQCALFVAGLGSGTMLEYDEFSSGKLSMVKVNDAWFDDVKDPKNNPVYAFGDIPGGTYPNLQSSGWFGGDKTPTITLEAVLVTNTVWVDSNTKGYADLIKKSLQWASTN